MAKRDGGVDSAEATRMKNILLVDDDDNVLAALRRHFHRHHPEWTLMTAAHGKEAMKIVREGSVDVLITDILMPQQEGLATIRELRHNYPDVKIIAISGGGRYQTGRSALDIALVFGAHHTLEKPFEPEELIATVESLLDSDNEGP